MRKPLLVVMTGAFGLLGGVLFTFGVLLTITGLAERESAIESWFNAFLGMMLVGNGALLLTVSLLAYIAGVASSAVQRMQPRPQSDPLPHRPVWYAQDAQRQGR